MLYSPILTSNCPRIFISVESIRLMFTPTGTPWGPTKDSWNNQNPPESPTTVPWKHTTRCKLPQRFRGPPPKLRGAIQMFQKLPQLFCGNILFVVNAHRDSVGSHQSSVGQSKCSGSSHDCFVWAYTFMKLEILIREVEY